MLYIYYIMFIFVVNFVECLVVVFGSVVLFDCCFDFVDFGVGEVVYVVGYFFGV